MEDIPTTFDSKNEEKLYNFWHRSGYFSSHVDYDKEPYTILIPPPNVTNNLHVGHAINQTFQDILIRYKKIKGFNTLFVPGMDHGGISTEQMVSNSLMTNRGITKEQLGRFNFSILLDECTLMYNTTLGTDTNIGQDSFDLGKRFCTKLWNSVKYITMNIDKNTVKFHSKYSLKIATPIDIWILNKLNNLMKLYEKCIDNYDFGEICRSLYNFVFNDFTNCYLECAKATIDNVNTKYILLKVIDTLLVMLHPIIPFLTEEIFQITKMYFSNYKPMKSIMLRKWPELFEITFDEDENNFFEVYREIMKIIRNTKSSFEIYKHDPIPLILISNDNKLKKYIQKTFIYIEKMCGIEEITYELKELDTKYVIDKKETYVLYFPITEKYKIDKIIKNLEERIEMHNKKITKVEETMEKLESKKKILKFEQNIKKEKEGIKEIEEKIEYYKELLN